MNTESDQRERGITVSNSSRKNLFSLAGKEAIRAERERRIVWSFGA
jgi:hypothetical protein